MYAAALQKDKVLDFRQLTFKASVFANHYPASFVTQLRYVQFTFDFTFMSFYYKQQQDDRYTSICA